VIHQRSHVHANVSVRFEFSEMLSWRSQQIQAFFRGIAEVLSANERNSQPVETVEKSANKKSKL
jgi:hypothetical protein